MNRANLVLGMTLLAAALAGPASAQTLPAGETPSELDCHKVSGDVVACRSSSPNGAAQPGLEVSLYSDLNVRLGGGTTDKNGVFLFKAPPVNYKIVVGGGPASGANLSSSNITEKPRRPGWHGDWVPVAAVDNLQKLQQWEDQFTSEKAPLVEKAEDELAK